MNCMFPYVSGIWSSFFRGLYRLNHQPDIHSEFSHQKWWCSHQTLWFSHERLWVLWVSCRISSTWKRYTDVEALTSCDLQQVVDANLVKPLEASWIWIQRELDPRDRDPILGFFAEVWPALAWEIMWFIPWGIRAFWDLLIYHMRNWDSVWWLLTK